MTIHWSLLGPSVVLLLWPADWLLSSSVGLRSFDCFQSLENSPRHRPWWWVPALWVDPLRGFFGTRLLVQALEFDGVSRASGWWAALVAVLTILATGIVCQMGTRRGGGGVLLAPLGFVAGVVAGLVPWAVALLAILTGVLGMFGFRQFHAFFGCGLVGVALLGLALGVDAAVIGAACWVIGLPVAVGIVSGCTLEVPTRNSSPAGATPDRADQGNPGPNKHTL